MIDSEHNIECLCLDCGMPIHRDVPPQIRPRVLRCTACAARRSHDRAWSSGDAVRYYETLASHEDERFEAWRLSTEALLSGVVFVTKPRQHETATGQGRWHDTAPCGSKGCPKTRAYGSSFCFDHDYLGEGHMCENERCKAYAVIGSRFCRGHGIGKETEA